MLMLPGHSSIRSLESRAIQAAITKYDEHDEGDHYFSHM
uniref:Integrase n=1 Tax=Ascaris lumbricoides TaxID=6252 RepID=A0A0M3IJ59_ASCLU